jgi:hypothetical protein
VAALLANDGPEVVREDYPQLGGAQIEAARDYGVLSETRQTTRCCPRTPPQHTEGRQRLAENAGRISGR